MLGRQTHHLRDIKGLVNDPGRAAVAGYVLLSSLGRFRPVLEPTGHQRTWVYEVDQSLVIGDTAPRTPSAAGRPVGRKPRTSSESKEFLWVERVARVDLFLPDR